MSKGWECPVCGKGVAPGEKTCDHGNQQVVYPPVYIPEPYPVYPSPSWPPHYPYVWTCGPATSTSNGTGIAGSGVAGSC